MTDNNKSSIKKINENINKLIIIIIGFVLVIAFLSPIMVILNNSLKSSVEISKRDVLALPEKISFENYIKAEQYSQLVKKIGNSILISSCVSFITVFIAFINGYVISIGRISVKGVYIGSFLMMYFLISMLIPAASIIYPLYYGFRALKLYNTRLSIIMVEIAYWLGFSTFLLTNVLKAFPKDLIDAAKIDGASQFTTMFGVVFPLTSSTITTLITIFFVWSWNNFFFPLILTISVKILPMPLGLLNFIDAYMSDEGPILAGGIMVSIPMIVFFFIFQKKITTGIMSGGIKG
jgi:raffinose/stachyose/melibiose transport system permease protein